MTAVELEATVASLHGFRIGLKLDKEITRRIIIEVAAEGEREPIAFYDEIRRRMLAASHVD